MTYAVRHWSETARDERIDYLDRLIRAGYGETPQNLIPDNWETVPGPNPWPSPQQINRPKAIKRPRYLRSFPDRARHEVRMLREA